MVAGKEALNRSNGLSSRHKADVAPAAAECLIFSQQSTTLSPRRSAIPRGYQPSPGGKVTTLDPFHPGRSSDSFCQE